MAINPKSLKNLKPSQKGSTHNPNGRPVKGIALVNAELSEKGYEPARKQDIEATYMAMLQLPHSDLVALAKAEEKPMLVRVLAKNMLGGKGFEIMERMLDRGVGKPTQKDESKVTVVQEMSDKDKKIVSTLINELKGA